MLIPERQVDFEHDVVERIRRARLAGTTHYMVVVAEGAGSAIDIGKRIHQEVGIDPRVTVLGHIQRGGSPSVRDRETASRMGYEAVVSLAENRGNRIIAIQDGRIVDLDMEEALQLKKAFPMDRYKILEALTPLRQSAELNTAYIPKKAAGLHRRPSYASRSPRELSDGGVLSVPEDLPELHRVGIALGGEQQDLAEPVQADGLPQVPIFVCLHQGGDDAHAHSAGLAEITVGSPFTGTPSIRIPRALTQSGQERKAETWLRRMSQERILGSPQASLP